MKRKSKFLICMVVSLALTGCKTTKTYSLTYVNGDTKTVVEVTVGETIEKLLEIDSKIGYDAYWTIDNKKISDGFVYDFNENKEAKLVYVPHTWKIVFDNDEHTKIDVTYNEKIGDLPEIPKKAGYKDGTWTIDNTIINSSTIYNWDKDTFATATYEKEIYTLSFEGLDESNNIQTSYDLAIGNLPAVTEFNGKGKEHYIGYWTIDNEIIDSEFIWNYQENKVAKPVYKAFTSSIENGSLINVMTESIKELYNAKNNNLLETAKNLLNKKEDITNLSYKLAWNEIKPFKYSLLRIGKDKELTNANTYLTYNHYVDLANLELNRTYYYQIEGFDDDYSIKSDIYSFKVTDGARIISIDSVENFKDIGSFSTSYENKQIKQNMIFRSGNLDSISEFGKKQLKELYGIKTELDLREEEYWKDISYLGSEVNYIHVNNKQGGVYYIDRGIENDFTGLATGGATLKDELLPFTESNNYPIDFHCAIGRDRTGTLAMILLGLLGVSEEDIYFDYITSAINGKASANDEAHLEELYNNIYQTVQYIKNMTGKTNLSEAIEEYLTKDFVGTNEKAKVGLSKEEVETIKNIMLEDK